jgi:hypothetical protein
VKSPHGILLSNLEENARKLETLQGASLRHAREPLAPAVQGSRIPVAPDSPAGTERVWSRKRKSFRTDQAPDLEEKAMAKGQMRQSKEKKKPKQDKDKKKGTSAYAQTYHVQPNNSPIGNKKD